MFKRTIIPAIVAVFALVACTKEIQNPEFGRTGSTEVHPLSVGIEAGSYLPADETKASMEAIVRVNWEKNDEVSVVNATTGKLLGGCLQATDSGEVVTFSGKVVGTIGENDKLYYIYPRVDKNDNEVAFEGYEIDLSTQQYNSTTPSEVLFCGYAEDVAASANISKRIKFNLVTSYVHLNMSNLPAKGGELTSVDLSNVNGGFKWVRNGDVVSAEPYLVNRGISVACTNGNGKGVTISNAGNAVVRFAVPESPKIEDANIARVLTVNKAYSNANYTKDKRVAAKYYNQLYSTWESNVTVEEKADKVEVKIDNGGSTDKAEGIIPVEQAFANAKPTEIGIGGVGTVTFNETATSNIKSNASGSTEVFFKIEDVTETKPVENVNLVYEVTMKTVDQNGKEVFSEGNAGTGSVATVTIPLGDNVESVQRVSLMDESWNLIEGGVVDDSVVFDETSRLLTFKVVHFSKYAIQYTEKPINAVAKIGDRKYETLASAIAAAQNGNTITMIADFATTEKVTIAADKDITLDLNGKEISYTTDGYGAFIENEGQLKVMDSGSNGIITAKFSKPNWSDGCYTINNAGTYANAGKLVIESGTIENTSPAGGLAWPVSNGIWGTKADLVINGGTIHSVNYVPVREYLQYGGTKTIVINGGKLISNNSRAIAIQFNDATVAETGSFVEINGGEFSCNGSGILYVDLHAANLNTTGFTMTVNGGNFKNANTSAPVLVYDDEGNSQTSAVLLSNVLKGGVYSKEPADEIVADGYYVDDNDDATYPWKVVEGGVAKIGNQKYPTLERAVAAAVTAGSGTIELLPAYIESGRYPQAWITSPCGADDVPYGMSSTYTFHAFNPNNDDEEIAQKAEIPTNNLDNLKMDNLSPEEKERAQAILEQVNPYLEWPSDFEVYFDSQVSSEDYSIGGHYDMFGSWLDGLTSNLEANQHLRLLKDGPEAAGMGSLSLTFEYQLMLAYVYQFNCGITSKKPENNAGKTFSVELYMYHPENENVKILISRTDYKFPQVK